jgi:4-amino-4-deoxy-L-arabinose transferase-like glycosyltransferase
VLRLPGLDQRGSWDSDQGHDMLVLQGLVTRGEVPLLGPPTSIGTFHHGAVYYYLLAPAALVSGSDPIAVTGEIALIGIAAVAATWWLARLIGGRAAGVLAAALAAVSPSGIDESTFIWNPNLVPLASALAFAGAVRAHRTRHVRWWLLAGLGAMVTMQCHVLGGVILPPLVVAWLLDVRARRRDGGALRPVLLAGAGAAAIIAAGFVPLAVSELGHGFAETRAIVAYLTAGGGGDSAALPVRLALVLLRSLSWPISGLLTDHPAWSIVAAMAVIGLAWVAWRNGGRDSRRIVGGLVGAVVWSVAALALVAPSLAVFTPGLPNDHYHAFLDPLVLAIAGCGLARLASTAGAGRFADERMPRIVAGALVAVLVVIEVAAWPPSVAPDGGWQFADSTAARIVDETRSGSGVILVGLPAFKPADALAFPLVRRGLVPGEIAPGGTGVGVLTVVVCDPLFDDAMGAACDGAAEDRWAAGVQPPPHLLDRFDAGTRRIVSIYAPGGVGDAAGDARPGY